MCTAESKKTRRCLGTNCREMLDPAKGRWFCPKCDKRRGDKVSRYDSIPRPSPMLGPSCGNTI
jgi:hypothetical protein